MHNKNKQKSSGYTIVETLIAMSIFVIVAVLGVQSFLNALHAQRIVIMEQTVAQNVSFALEFMSRQMRTAVKSSQSPDDDCLPFGSTFNANPPSIIFLNDDGECIEFRTQGGRLLYTSDATVPLGTREYIELISSGLVAIDTYDIIVSGQTDADNMQPKVTTILEASGVPQTPKDPQNVVIRAQTTISTRLLDI
ncbi:MAG: prepilin-type N-terminal cleavage/methylation domain-containing protein [Candidatus Spechtbacterales bacterium]|nr:prepilin-type N-terminal cleavage/methylation domain-containing protein [Candidatus Spechtbacterales bacterium]